MARLSDCVYTFDASILRNVLERFELTFTEEIGHTALLRFEVLSPDAFVWRMRIDDNIYYLLAEDYIPSLDYVRNIFKAYLNTDK